jgi:ABC-type amino acid transport substrate-binding protein
LPTLQDKVRLLPTVIHTETFHMVVSMTVPADTVEKMRKAIQQLEATGELKRLLDKWNAY